jgi:hypothetical protein
MEHKSKPRQRVAQAIGLFATVLAVGLAGESEGRAFCPLRTCQDTPKLLCERSNKGCIRRGELLFQNANCVTFAASSSGTHEFGLSGKQWLAIVDQAFERWRSVECQGGEHPGFAFANAGLVETDESLYCPAAYQNANVWLLQRDWPAAANPLGDTLGNAQLAFEPTSGEILDSDVELNSNEILSLAKDGSLADVLLAVATHEAGHVLGLSHSNVSGALMAATYAKGELVGHALSPDDIDAICTMYPPGAAPQRCAVDALPAAATDREACIALSDQISDGSWEVPEGCAFRPPLPTSADFRFQGFALLTFGCLKLRRSQHKLKTRHE